MRAVNLLPEKKRGPGVGGGRRALLVVGAAVLVGGLGYWGYDTRQGAAEAERAVAAAEAEQQELQSQLGLYQAAEARYAEQNVRKGVVVGLASGRVNWERVVRDTVTVLPKRVWLDSIRAESPAAATGAAAATPPGATAVPDRGLHIEGYAFTQPQVALAMARIAAVSGLGQPVLTSSESQERGSRRVVRFVIEVPVDQRAQDRPTLTPATAADPAATNGAAP